MVGLEQFVFAALSAAISSATRVTLKTCGVLLGVGECVVVGVAVAEFPSPFLTTGKRLGGLAGTLGQGQTTRARRRIGRECY